MRPFPSRRALAAAAGTVAITAMLAAGLGVPAHAVDTTPGPAVTADPAASTTTSGRSRTWLTDGLGTPPTDPAKVTAFRAEVKKRIGWATTERASAMSALEKATELAQETAQLAQASERRAIETRDRLTLWTSYLYRVGGDNMLMALFNDKNNDPLDFLRGATDAANFSNEFIADLHAASDAALQARTTAARADEARQAASRRASDVESAREALLLLLAFVQPDAPKTVAGAYGKTDAQTLIDGKACPTAVPANTLRDGSDSAGPAALCQQAVAQAATPQAALAIMAAFQMLGAPYACGGEGRMEAFKFDCSSLVSRAYFLGAGIDTAGSTWAPSTRDMVPWDGVPLAWWASYVDPQYIRPGDLILYDTGGSTYRHVVMYLGNGYMLHTNACGDVAHVSTFWGAGAGKHGFLVARRVIAPGGYRIPDPKPIPTTVVPKKPKPDKGAGDPKVTVPVTTPPVVPIPTPSPSPSPSSPSDTPSDTTTGTPSDTPTDSPSDTPSDSPSSTGPLPTCSPSPSESWSPSQTPTGSPTCVPASPSPSLTDSPSPFVT